VAALGPGEHVFHIALARDWSQAQERGDYRVSTLGRSLAEEGFIHFSRRHQVAGVRAAFYADVGEPLVLLEIDPALLDVPLALEAPPGAGEAYPHVYGPVPVGAVVRVTELS
jgi:uncharacterized protein (DUF952 family)